MMALQNARHPLAFPFQASANDAITPAKSLGGRGTYVKSSRAKTIYAHGSRSKPAYAEGSVEGLWVEMMYVHGSRAKTTYAKGSGAGGCTSKARELNDVRPRLVS